MRTCKKCLQTYELGSETLCLRCYLTINDKKLCKRCYQPIANNYKEYCAYCFAVVIDKNGFRR